MELTYQRMTKKSDKAILDKVQNTFETCFPPEERPPFHMIIGWKNASFFAVFRGEEYVGLVNTVEYHDLLYVFFLAIDAEHRKQGIGGTILTDLKKKHDGKRLFLLVDELDPKYEDYDVRLARYGFYQSNGFKPSGIFVLEFGVRYEMFVASEKVSKEEFVAVMTHVIGKFRAWMFYRNV